MAWLSQFFKSFDAWLHPFFWGQFITFRVITLGVYNNAKCNNA